jgi:putative heme-binding domain-containing protein
VIARLNMLTTDVAISPGGDLYVSCHSGAPDWGTGPNGTGKIFKISYIDTKAPQPIAIWPSGAMEVSVAFDQPIDASITQRLEEMRIEFGEYVSTADRLEVLKPPYKAVNQQEATPRGKLRVVAARLTPDHRTLVLTTDPHPQSVRYALTLPGVKAADSKRSSATVDLAYDLNGAEATWFEPGDRQAAKWSGWWPHLDSDVNTAFTVRSSDHERLSKLLHRPGQLQLRTQLALAGDNVRVHVEAAAPFELSVGTKSLKAQSATAGRYTAETTLHSGGQPEIIAILVQTGTTKSLDIHATYATTSDPTSRPLPFGALLLPWAPLHQTPPPLKSGKTEMAGGDFEAGRSLFFGERLKCSTCHRLRREGGTVGPDLSNLVHRDPASVLRDIKEPSAAINPDYVAHNVRLRDGGDLTGFVRTQTGDSLRLVGSDGKDQFLRRNEVIEMRPSAVSLMPTGLLEGLKEREIRDLMTFLLNEPPTRSQAEVDAVFHQEDSKKSIAPLNVVLVASKQDHGPGQHDYPAWQKKWMTLLGHASGVTAEEAWEWPTPEQWRKANVIVFYFWNHDWTAERYQELDDYQARGGGAVVFHAATIADTEPEKLAARIGLSAQPGPTKYLHTPIILNFIDPTNNAVTSGFKSLKLIDEPYWPMFGDTNRIEVLATADMEGQARPLIWTFQKGKGRVFASIVGHYTWTWDDPLFRILALRGVAWAAGESTERLAR